MRNGMWRELKHPQCRIFGSLAGASSSELRDRLEFLPAEACGGKGKPRTLQEAEQLVEKARIASLKRRTGLES